MCCGEPGKSNSYHLNRFDQILGIKFWYDEGQEVLS